jgi:hypothetical protein
MQVKVTKELVEPTKQIIVSGETFSGTQFDFRKQFNLNQSSLSKVISGKLKSHLGWRLSSLLN